MRQALRGAAMTTLEMLAYNHVKNELNIICEANKQQITLGNFFIKTYYGTGKYILKKTKCTEGGLPGLPVLIHHIMYEDDLYKTILSNEQLNEVKRIVDDSPKKIYRHPGNEIYENLITWMSEKINKKLIWEASLSGSP